MAATTNVVFGVFGIVLGLLWAAKPVTMSRLQQRLLFFGAGGDEVEVNGTLGRVAGIVLAVFGVYLIVWM